MDELKGFKSIGFSTVGTMEQLKEYSVKKSPGMVFHVSPKGVSLTDETNNPSANGHWELPLNHCWNSLIAEMKLRQPYLITLKYFITDNVFINH